MAGKLTEEEMREEILKYPKLRMIWGALRDIVPNAAVEYKERRAHDRPTDN
jgi:hypothetical protein